ncbi:MAG: NAD-dependent epimerase/dehydratase family protein [Spirochaetaceae bacterium]
MKRALITGALGQLGSELAVELRSRLGTDNVVLSDIRDDVNRDLVEAGPFERLDAVDGARLSEVVRRYSIDTIYHLAALLSATAETRPQEAWRINMGGVIAALEVAREEGCAVFTPSSIGSFGPTTPKEWTAQDTLQRPTSMYGVTKVAGELLCDYYFHKYGVDTRGVRYPGLISYKTPPGGGTTDYAVEIFYAAVAQGRYTCFLKGDTYLDMMYMPDAIKAAIDIMEADPDHLRHRNAFNVTAMSICPEELAGYIRAHIPSFQIAYKIDPVRQAIADSWPNRMEDYAARVEWGWAPEYDTARMTDEMLARIRERSDVEEHV